MLNSDEQKGKESLVRRVEQGEIIVTFTDKDGRVVICPPALYKEAANVQLSKDQKVSWDVLKPTEILMNRTAVQLVKMFEIGNDGTDSQRDRVKKASITKDVAPPVVSYLWKTHKSYENIPPTRPVCAATSGPISRASDLMSSILTPMLRQRQCDVICDSTEDMLHSVTQANLKIDET